MFMRSGQLFSHGESASSWQTPGPAAVRDDVVFVLLAEMAQGGEHRIGRRLAQAAQRALANHAAELIQHGQVVACAPRPSVTRFRMRSALFKSHAARHAFAARLGMGELDEVARHVDHAVVFIHDHHAAGAHDGAELREVFVVDRAYRTSRRECIRPRDRRSARLSRDGR